VIVAVQFGAVPLHTTFAFGIKVVAEEERLKKVELQARVLSVSVIVKVTAFAVSSLVEVFEISEITGAAFPTAGSTVKSKEAMAERVPSVTVTSNVLTPD
jgi:hypothetical protein